MSKFTALQILNAILSDGKLETNETSDQIHGYGFERKESLHDLFEAQGGGVYRKPRFRLTQTQNHPLKLRCGDRLELSCLGLIVDQNTSTIGIIQQCDNDPKKCRKLIQETVTLRHIILQNCRQGHWPYFVELVLVTEASKGVNGRAAISDALQDYMLHSSYLHSIGVNLLKVYPDNLEHQNPQTVRAFAWLLQGVRSWYDSPTFKQRFSNANEATDGVKPVPKPRELTALELNDFRLPGKRKWSLEPNHSLHLIHGHNGTGKSTITESFELLLRGNLERLGDIDYRKVLRYQPESMAAPVNKQSPASVTADFLDGKTQFAVGENGAVFSDDTASSFSPNPEVDPGSFRLEQHFADDLVRTGSGNQIGRFLQAFFPEAHVTITQFRNARDDFEQAFNEVPDHVRKQLSQRKVATPEEVLERIDACRSDDQFVIDKVLELTPVSELRKLIASAASLEKSYTWEQSQPTEWDRVWKEAVADATAIESGLSKLLPYLQKLNDWQVRRETTADTQEGLAAILNEWLDACAKVDLMSKELDILRVKADVPKHDFSFLSEGWSGTNQQIVEEQEKKLEEARAERNELRNKIGSVSVEGESHTTLESMSEAPATSDSVFGLLDEYVILSSSETPSKLVKRAIRKKQQVTFELAHEKGSLSIGSAGGLNSLIGELASKQKVASDITRASKRWRGSINGLVKTLKHLRAKAEACQTADNKALDEFKKQLSKDGPLSQAFNELTALFTPAKWAYSDVSVNDESEFKLGDVAADLRLNTAELNTLAMVLFFLCAPSNRNPLRMLMLDDPLQNMDELTVTTVARGISRLLSIWKFNDELKHWMVTILLHGEENLERLRSECRCIAYFLKWLTPQVTDGSIERDRDPRSELTAASPLEDVIVSAD